MNKKLNIVILTAPDPKKAAGILAYDLMKALNSSGHKTIIVTNSYTAYYESGIYSLTNFRQAFVTRLFNKIKRVIIKKSTSNPDFYMLSINQTKQRSYYKKILRILPYKPDLFIYLFPQSFLNAEDLYLLNQHTKAPIYWYMMDMAPITGGCHYAWDCVSYKTECGYCPGLYSTVFGDKANMVWNYKKKYIDQTYIIPVAASEWQFNQLKDASLFREKRKHKILLPIDNNIFKEGSTYEARLEMNLPVNKRILFFGGVNANSKRKGFKELANALASLKKELNDDEASNIYVIVAGNYTKELENILPFSYQFLGYLSFEQLAKAYQAADIFICPSIEDSGPMMINQSIMCGTPVVAFEMGVALDLVKSGETGYLAKLKDSDDMAEGIKKILLLNSHEYETMSENCVTLGKQQCSFESFLNNIHPIIYDNQF